MDAKLIKTLHDAAPGVHLELPSVLPGLSHEKVVALVVENTEAEPGARRVVLRMQWFECFLAQKVALVTPTTLEWN